MEQPVSMDCAGCRRGFSLDELNAARQASPAATPAPRQPPPSPSAPADAATDPEIADSNTDGDDFNPDLDGDVYDPETAVHTPRPTRDYVGGVADLSPGDLIQEAVQGTVVNFLPVAAVTIVVSIPAWLYSLYVIGGMQAVQAGEMGWGAMAIRFLGMLVVGFLSQLLGAAALTHVIRCWLSDKTVVLTESIGVAMRSLIVLVILSFVQSIGIGIGYLLFLLPGVILTAGWAVAVPAAVVERTGIGGSLARSWRLTDGYKLVIFLTFLILGLVNFAIGSAALMLIPDSLATAFDAATSTVFTAVESVLTALIYFKLRSADEGVPIDGLG